MLRVLEFYSGIGGFHFALRSSTRAQQRNAIVVQAFDVNRNANQTYTQNFPYGPPATTKTIESLSAKDISRYEAEMWMLSPPCQPYTRIGKQRDVDDPRAQSFLHLIALLPQLTHRPNYIILENVKGFEVSETHRHLLDQFKSMNYFFEEFFLSPTQFGIPNSRLRYFCLARRTPFVSRSTSDTLRKTNNTPHQTNSEDSLSKENVNIFLDYIPFSHFFDENGTPRLRPKPLRHFLEMVDSENSLWEQYQVPNSVILKSGLLFDIVTPDSTNSCCFTKSYGRYVEGTGSVLQTADKLWKVHSCRVCIF